jgi:ATP/maltotriose-dependent transcriptional regulator MalT
MWFLGVRVKVLGGCLMLATIAAAPPAFACGNVVERRVDPRVDALLLAERALESRDYRTAARMAQRFNPDLRRADDRPSPVARAARVMALVVVRSGGRWLAGGAADSAADRAQNFEWAISKLRRHAMRALNHPGRLSDLAEALAAVDKYHDEARRILEHLAARDLVTSAYAYAALSRLRAASGDSEGASRALDECRKLDRKGRVCAPAMAPDA